MRIISAAGLGVIATVSLAQPLLAENVTYLGLRGSYAMTDDAEADAPLFGGDISFEHSFGGSASIGMFLSPDVRIEAEMLFAHNRADGFDVTRDGINGVPLTGQSFPLTGDIDVIAPMFNVILELPLEDTSVDLYYGAGVGGAHIDVNASSTAGGIELNDDAWALAYQFMAGATMPLADGVEGMVGYRYFGTTQFSVDDPILGNFDMDLTTHSVELGLLFRL